MLLTFLRYEKPLIALLNIELELKAERDNAEIRVDSVDEYQNIVDAEWQILYDKLEKIHKSGAKVVLSRLPIGDVATQYFADRDMFCAGRVAEEDLKRTMKACGGAIQSSVENLETNKSVLGTCEIFQEEQIGGERYILNIFTCYVYFHSILFEEINFFVSFILKLIVYLFKGFSFCLIILK